jgi:peptidoglycan/xylan/chitin deacetylase (PgdA/CDA1 family)
MISKAESHKFILTFHGVGEPPAHVGADERPYWLSERCFRQILDWVAARPAAEVPPIHLTFDDGNASDLHVALPALVERRLKAHFFVLAGRLDAPHFLSRRDLQELLQAGMTIGSHGWDHVDWRAASDAELNKEMRDARLLLEEVTGQPIAEAAIPFGRYDGRVIRSLLRHGFRLIFSSDGGLAHRPPLMSRNTLKADVTPTAIEDLIRRETSSRSRLYRAAMRKAKSTLPSLTSLGVR